MTIDPTVPVPDSTTEVLLKSFEPGTEEAARQQWLNYDFAKTMNLELSSRPAPPVDSSEANRFKNLAARISTSTKKVRKSTHAEAIVVARESLDGLYCRRRGKLKRELPYQFHDRFDPGTFLAEALPKASAALRHGPAATEHVDVAGLAALRDDAVRFCDRHAVRGDVRFNPIFTLAEFLGVFCRKLTR